MDFLIITGLSGAGKSKINSTLEDMGYYCVDNMPAVMIPRFAELCMATRGRYERVALVTDVRGGESFDTLFESLDKLDAMHLEYRIVFVEAADSVIIRRYKETRRSHPLAKSGLSIDQAVKKEREIMEPLRNRARYIINTSTYSTSELRTELLHLFSNDLRDAMSVTIYSFGYKAGIPIDSDLVFDVRFMPNPYYIDELKNLTGLDEAVQNFVFGYNQSVEFMELLQNMLSFLLPLYVAEGKTSLVIAIGCTGGQHRSVAVAERLKGFIEQKGYTVRVRHVHIPEVR